MSMSYSFLNASRPLDPSCVLQGSRSTIYKCGYYYITNTTQVTKLNGTCLQEQFPGGYELVGPSNITPCSDLPLTSNSSSKVSVGRRLWGLVVFAVFAALLPYASAGHVPHIASKPDVFKRQIDQSFVITSGPTQVEGETKYIGPTVCEAGKVRASLQLTLTYNESSQISEEAAQVFDHAVSYPTSVAKTASGSAGLLTENIDAVCASRCGRITFTPFLQRVVGDFRPGGPSNYTRDTPQTINGGEPNGRFTVTCD